MAVSSPEPVFVLLLDPTATAGWEEVAEAVGRLNVGARPVTIGDGWAALSVGDGIRHVPVEHLRSLPSVERIVGVPDPYCLASRVVFGSDRAVSIRAEAGRSPGEGIVVGDGAPVLMLAGLPPVRRGTDVNRLAAAIRAAGATGLHAGEFAGRSRADGPSAIGPEGLRRARRAADAEGLFLSVEVSDPRELELVVPVADVVQAASRNMQDFSLLRELGRIGLPVLLKRGAGATVEEFLLAAEYVLTNGNGRVMLCESGIRTFDPGGRPRFEINAVPLLKRATHLPILADPTQTVASGRLVPAVARAAVAAGADGLVVAVTDGEQPAGEDGSIDVATLRRLVLDVTAIAGAVGRAPRPEANGSRSP